MRIDPLECNYISFQSARMENAVGWPLFDGVLSGTVGNNYHFKCSFGWQNPSRYY